MYFNFVTQNMYIAQILCYMYFYQINKKQETLDLVKTCIGTWSLKITDYYCHEKEIHECAYFNKKSLVLP